MTKATRNRLSGLIGVWSIKTHDRPRYRNAARFVAFGKAKVSLSELYQQKNLKSAYHPEFRAGVRGRKSHPQSPFETSRWA
jgi:hypothetical protein